jgi:hypothetical protein
MAAKAICMLVEVVSLLRTAAQKKNADEDRCEDHQGI